MITKSDLTQVEPFVYQVSTSTRGFMRVPARLYADDYVLELALGDRSLEQLVNTASLPGIARYALAMPDVHQGYGFPIGGVAATSLPNGSISPGGVGYDINCGVRLLTSQMEARAVQPYVDNLLAALYQSIPSGVGETGALRLSKKALAEVLERGSEWAIQKGHGDREDAIHTEDQGCMPSADAGAVSPRALERGANQLGTLGSGNHFLELDEVMAVYDKDIASAFGLWPGQLVVWVHCGSRGLGHQVCQDAVNAMQQCVTKYHITLPDRELACAPMDSPEGQHYFAAMSAAANYAWANRQVITQRVRECFEAALAGRINHCELRVLYDVCHNIAKVEEHSVDGKLARYCVHRKGATRAFGPGRAEVPADFRAIGQPVLIPGSMGTGSFVLAGTEKAMCATFGSTCHGAGRVSSRAKARRNIRGQDLRDELAQRGILVRAGSMSGLAEEAPDAYKDLEHVVDTVHGAGIARKVARTRPLGVIKG